MSAQPKEAGVLQYPIDKIVAVDRHRAELGDIELLAASIAAVGLLHPIVVTPSGRLVAGFRRLAACRALGWGRVPVTVAETMTDARALLIAERDENTCRLDMLPSEKVSLGRALEELERPRAEARMKAGKVPPVNFSEGARGNTGDIVGTAVGMSRPTYTRAKVVVDTATDETLPDEVRAVAVAALAEMDRTGKVTPAYNMVAEVTGRRGNNEARAERVRGASFKPTTPRQKQLAEAQKNRIVAALSGISGFCRALDDVDVRMAVAALDDDERQTWIEQARESARAVKKFADKLQNEG